MTILVTGSTGTVGSEAIVQLAAEGADVRALTRSPEEASFPAGITPVKGDMLDTDAMRSALKGVRSLFLLNAVTPDELTQALITISLAREAGVEQFVYLSVIHADRFTNVPHFAGKYAVEHMFEEQDISATILRPGYYMQNDASLKDQILGEGVYTMPVGSNSPLLMVDTRDLGEVAARELLRRERASNALSRETIDVVAPEALTGSKIADIWTDLLGRKVRYGGDDLSALEQQMRNFTPDWMAYDMRLMMGRFQRDGMEATPETDARLQEILGRPMRSYRNFARETAEKWVGKESIIA